MSQSSEIQEPLKDEGAAHPVANCWRPTLQEIVKSFSQADYRLKAKPMSVEPVSAAVAAQIENFIANYGEMLSELPDETWRSSVSQWMGTYWDVLVDLWTIESGESDMVLNVRVFEVGNVYRFEIVSVHVP